MPRVAVIDAAVAWGKFQFLVLFFPVWRMVVPQAHVSLAFGGGGARSWAHLGVLRVLEEEQIPVSGLVGTSMGAVVASCLRRRGAGLPFPCCRLLVLGSGSGIFVFPGWA